MGFFFLSFFLLITWKHFFDPHVKTKACVGGSWWCVCLLGWIEEPFEVTVCVCVCHASRSELVKCPRCGGGVWTEVTRGG